MIEHLDIAFSDVSHIKPIFFCRKCKRSFPLTEENVGQITNGKIICAECSGVRDV